MTSETSVYTKTGVEISLLHALIHEPKAAKKWIFKMEPDLFYSQVNRKVFYKVRELYAAGKGADMVVLDSELVGNGSGVEVGNLVEIFSAFGYMDSFEQYVGALEEAKKRRDVYAFAKGIMTAVGDHMIEVEEVIGKVRNFSAGFRQRTQEESLLEAMMKGYEDMFNRDENRYCKTGIDSIDRRVGGFEPGTLTIIGARPSVGKSILGMNILMHNASLGKNSILINREMVKKNFARRMVSNVVGLDAEIIRRGGFTDAEDPSVQTYLAGVQAINDMPLDVLNWPSRPSDIRGVVIEAMEGKGLDILVVDYLQRLEPDGRFSKRNEAVGSISWALKDIAMKYHIPVVALAQLNRTAANKRPVIAELKESGDIEQDADTIILLHEPNEEDVAPKNRETLRKLQEEGCDLLECIIGKNREGTKSIIPLVRDARHMKLIQPRKEEKGT